MDSTPARLTAATLNISGPSVERAKRLVDHLVGLDADVLVLTETRNNAGTEHLIRGLSAAGYDVEAPPLAKSGERGAAIASRLPRLQPSAEALTYLPHRLPQLTVRFGGQPLLLIGAYVPSRDASREKIERKQRFLSSMLAHVRSLTDGPSVMLLGDLNIVGRDHEPRFSAFRAWEYDALDSLRAGYVDAHQIVAPGTQAHSWIGRRGAGYQYDYGFVSRDLASAVNACWYDHSAREARLTDHAAVRLEISADTVGRRETERRGVDLVGV